MSRLDLLEASRSSLLTLPCFYCLFCFPVASQQCSRFIAHVSPHLLTQRTNFEPASTKRVAAVDRLEFLSTWQGDHGNKDLGSCSCPEQNSCRAKLYYQKSKIEMQASAPVCNSHSRAGVLRLTDLDSSNNKWCCTARAKSAPYATRVSVCIRA